MLSGRRVGVSGSDTGFGRELALGLEDHGATVTADPPWDVVVHAEIDPAALERQPLAETGAADWDRRCEAVLETALAVAQDTYRVLCDQGGLLVFVTPTVGMTGAAGLVPFATAIEGIRALAKSAARQWGGDGIRVNCVAPPAELLAPEAGRLSPDVAEPALGEVPSARGAVASAIALLAATGSTITGATIVVDGGVVMVP